MAIVGNVNTAEPLQWSANEAAAMLASREISSRELTERVLDRINTLNPAVNAVVELQAEAALRDAAAADEALTRGEPTGPLCGVPMTIKEAFHVAGMRTTWGDPAAGEFVAERDARVVTRLKRAGAAIIGKTNVAYRLADFQSANDLYGATNNPWDLARTPGGSSGGSAAALAAGMTFLEYGSDLAGSIRIPASFCGVYGLKPSVGIVPLTGFQPAGPPMPKSEMTYMSALGPLARSADDLRLALSVTAGPEAPAARAYSWSLPASRRSRLAEFRVGVVLDDPHAAVSSDVGARLSDTVDALAALGTTVIEGWPEGVEPGESSESFGFHVNLFIAFQHPGLEHPELSKVIQQERRRMAIREAWADYFTGIDVFLCPANFTSAFAHDFSPFEERMIATPQGPRPYRQQPFWSAHASLPGLPAVVAPVGRTPAGLPVGMQIVGPLFEDDTAITFAQLLAESVGGYEAPDLIGQPT